MSRKHIEIPIPGIAAYIGFAAQILLVQFEVVGVPGFSCYPFDKMEAWGTLVCSVKVCLQQQHLLDHFMGQQMFNLLFNLGMLNPLKPFVIGHDMYAKLEYLFKLRLFRGFSGPRPGYYADPLGWGGGGLGKARLHLKVQCHRLWCKFSASYPA